MASTFPALYHHLAINLRHGYGAHQAVRDIRLVLGLCMCALSACVWEFFFNMHKDPCYRKIPACLQVERIF